MVHAQIQFQGCRSWQELSHPTTQAGPKGHIKNRTYTEHIDTQVESCDTAQLLTFY